MENNNRMARHYENQFDNLKLENERNRKIVKSAFKTMQDNYDKLKEDNKMLLEHLKAVTYEYEVALKLLAEAGSFAFNPNQNNLIINSKKAIKQAESK